MAHEGFDWISYVIGELPYEQSRAHHKHLSRCAACSEENSFIAKQLALLDSLRITPSATLVEKTCDAVMREIDRPAPQVSRRKGLFWSFPYSYAVVSACLLLIIAYIATAIEPQLAGDGTIQVIVTVNSGHVENLATGETIGTSGFHTLPPSARITVQRGGELKLVFPNEQGRTKYAVEFASDTVSLISSRGDGHDIELIKGACLVDMGGDTNGKLTISYEDNRAIAQAGGKFEFYAAEIMMIPVYLRQPAPYKPLKWMFTDNTLKEITASLQNSLNMKFDLPSEAVENIRMDFYSDETEGSRLFSDFASTLKRHGLMVIRKADSVYSVNSIISNVAQLIDRRLIVRAISNGVKLERGGVTVRSRGGEDLSIDSEGITRRSEFEPAHYRPLEISRGIQREDTSSLASLKFLLVPTATQSSHDRYLVEVGLIKPEFARFRDRLDKELVMKTMGRNDIILPGIVYMSK